MIFFYFQYKITSFWQPLDIQNTKYLYIKLEKAVDIYKNQTKNHSVIANIYKVYIICTPNCDAFRNSSFSLLSIMEYYKRSRWRVFYFLYPRSHSTRIVFALFGNLVSFLVLPLRCLWQWHCPFLALVLLN